MLLPYNVDRPARRAPNITYALMAINVAVYLLTAGYSNYRLYQDRPARETPTEETAPADGESPAADAPANDSGAAKPRDAQQRERWAKQHYFGPIQAKQLFAQGLESDGLSDNTAQSEEEPGEGVADEESEEGLAKYQKMSEAELDVVFRDPKQAAQFRQDLFMATHGDALLVLDTHPDVHNLLAYFVMAPSLLTIFTSMFLHGDLQHLMGNMLYLWVFGRATEDALGRGLYLASYLVCGFAATFLYHIISNAFSGGFYIPFMGASGAIAGVQGLFAPRFFRTPVRILYLKFIGARIFYPALSILSFILATAFGLGASAVTFALLIVLAGTIIIGQDDLWGELHIAAMWAMGIWLVVFNLAPAIIQMLQGHQGGGVAYWAHIGGFFCGAGYAFLIGSHKEAKTEYLVDEARASLDNRFGSNAIESALEVIKMKPNDPVGYQLLAEGYAARNKPEEARQNFEIAIAKYFEKNENTQAANLYIEGLLKDSSWVLPPSLQMQVSAQLAKDGLHKEAAETIVKIPYHHPEAKESEMAFLRGAQMYMDRLDSPMVAMELLHEFGNRYPNSQWMPQAMRAYQTANERFNLATAQNKPA